MNIFNTEVTVSYESNNPFLSSCKSRLYARGNPFRIVNKDTRFPMVLPDLPLEISAKSGFLFWHYATSGSEIIRHLYKVEF